MSWILLSFIAPFLWAIGNVGDKFIFSKWIKEPALALTVFGIVGFAASIIVFLIKGWPSIPLPYTLLALASGLIYFFANWFYYGAVKHEEVSRVIALVYLDPLFTAILSGIFLGEIFSFIKYLGICLLVAGSIAISYKKGLGFHFSKGVKLAIASALLFAVNNFTNKFLVNQFNLYSVFSLVRIGTFLGAAPLLYFYRRPFGELVKTGAGFAFTMLNNSIGIFAILIFTMAMNIGYITLTTSLAATQPFFVLFIMVILGLFYPQILKEEGGKRAAFQKLFAIILMFLGVLLITKV